MTTTFDLARLCSHAAAVSPKAMNILQDFMHAMKPLCPRLCAAYPMTSKRERHDALTAVSHVAKAFVHLETIEEWLCSAGRFLSAQGLHASHADFAKRAMLNAIKKHAGTSWNAEIEEDWKEMLERVFWMMSAGMARSEVALPQRLAA